MFKPAGKPVGSAAAPGLSRGVYPFAYPLMPYRVSLYDHGAFAVDFDAYSLLTDAQRARFATWSIQTGKPVVEIAREGKFVIEEYNTEHRTYMLTGILPHCGLFGGMTPDGFCHT